jgi:hypothetical protein
MPAQTFCQLNNMRVSIVSLSFSALLCLSFTLSWATSELVRCRVCFGLVSVNATHCIHCGEPKFQDELRVIEKDALQDRGGVFFEVNGREPFQGAVVDGRYANGHPKIQQEYQDGKKWGVRRKWYENGQVMQHSMYADGVAHGLMQEWHENGMRMAEGTFKEGKLEGVVRRWYDDGKREAEYPYKDGELEGIVMQWNKKGVMIAKKSFEKGKLLARLAVDPPEPEIEKVGEGQVTAALPEAGTEPAADRAEPLVAPLGPDPEPAKELPVRQNVFEGLKLGFPE